MTEPLPTEEAAAHRSMAAMLFNRTWELLDLPDRSTEQDEEMMAATFGQRYHWYLVGTPRNLAIADWQVSRVLAVLGYAELARRFGERSLDVCEEHGLDAFVTAYAHEAIARAADVMADAPARTHHIAQAQDMARGIRDADERSMLLADVEMICD